MTSSYVGIITKQSDKAGITLRAKVTSPKGNFSKTKDFKCMVKPFGLNDLQCVLKDLAIISERMLASDLLNIKENIISIMPKRGEHDTNVRYTSTIPEFLSNDGVVLSRPNYGTANKAGKITVTVSKGIESVKRTIDISVAQYNKDEIASFAIDTLTWEKIRGANALESNTQSSGLLNVSYDLNLIKTLNVTGSSSPVAVTWIIEDGLKPVLGGDRISSTGTVTKKSYTDTMTLINSGQLSTSAYNITAINGIPAIRLRNLKVTGKVTIGDGTDDTVLTKDFILNTMTETITNTEVANHLVNNATIQGQIPEVDETFTNVYYNTKNISWISTAGTKINLFTANEILNNSYDNLFGTNKGIIITNVNWSITDHSGKPYAEDLSEILVGGGINTTGVVPVVEIKALPENETAIAFKCTANVSSYGGDTEQIEMLFKIKLQKQTI